MSGKRRVKSEPVLLLADPPWFIKTYSEKGRGRVQKYECMSERDLLDLHPTIKDLAGKNACMMMWTTAPHAEQAMALLAHWGFSFKTIMCWKKPNTGYGRWARSNGEFVLIGTRGKFPCRLPKEWTTVFEGAREKRHSAKPERLQDLIDKRWPDVKRIELFARRRRAGWECIGGDLGAWITPSGIITRYEIDSKALIELGNHSINKTGPFAPAPPEKKSRKRRFQKGAQLDIEDAVNDAK